MAQKSAVSALQEYCAQKRVPPPTYEWIDSEDGSYVCRAQVMNTEADGQGRSKRDAKHLAASNLIKSLRTEYPDINNTRPVDVIENPTVDMVAKLRDYCVQQQHPLPIFEIVQQGGSPDAPEFIAMCSVATIKRYGTSEKKKDAKQKAAQSVFRLVYEGESHLQHLMQVASLDQKVEDFEAERYKKFKTYRELTDSHIADDPPGILLSERHNYFKKFYPELKAKAKAILSNPAYYDNYKKQTMDIFHALKIKPRITKFPGEKTIEQIVQIETNCDYDAIFANVESEVYKYVVGYFRDMLD